MEQQDIRIESDAQFDEASKAGLRQLANQALEETGSAGLTQAPPIDPEDCTVHGMDRDDLVGELNDLAHTAPESARTNPEESKRDLNYLTGVLLAALIKARGAGAAGPFFGSVNDSQCLTLAQFVAQELL